MSDFKAIMHPIQFRLGSAADPAGELAALPKPCSWIWGPISERGEGKEWKMKV